MKITNQDAPLVLIVDDERMMRILLRRAIEKEGYRTVEANSGEEALSIYQNLQPDMILLDAHMPGIDGFECCREIRKHAFAPVQLSRSDDGTSSASEKVSNHCPVLMITALDDVESVDRAFEAGATDYMTKPVNWAVLRQRLHRLIART